MKRWLRHNWIGLIAVAVLLPATVGITFATQWTSYFSGRDSAPVSVAKNTDFGFSTAEWRFESGERITADSPEGQRIGLPPETALVVVTVRITPDGSPESPGCLVRLEELDRGADSRSWAESTYDPIDYSPTDGTQTYCPTDTTEPYVLESTFVVPADAVDGLGLSIVVPGELPRYLSFRL